MGPYFEGQRASPCGHYYPDVVRVEDVKQGHHYHRILNCIECGGDYLVPIGAGAYSSDKNDRDGLEEVRARERERLRAR